LGAPDVGMATGTGTDMNTMAVPDPIPALDMISALDTIPHRDATSTPDMGPALVLTLNTILALGLVLTRDMIPTPDTTSAPDMGPALALNLDMTPIPALARAAAPDRDPGERGGGAAEAGDWLTFARAARWAPLGWKNLGCSDSEHIFPDLFRLVTMGAA